jgi:hypothetical protein
MTCWCTSLAVECFSDSAEESVRAPSRRRALCQRDKRCTNGLADSLSVFAMLGLVSRDVLLANAAARSASLEFCCEIRARAESNEAAQERY